MCILLVRSGADGGRRGDPRAAGGPPAPRPGREEARAENLSFGPGGGLSRQAEFGQYSGFKALSVIEEEPIDLVFLDIQMPELNGLELSRLVGNKVKIIFTTAFEQYALEGFRVDALDYLLKPFNYTEFLRAATKALRWIEMSRAENVSTNVPDSIFVKSDYKLIQIQLKDILYIEGLKDYIRIQTEDKEGGILTLMSMKSIEDHLPGDIFIRVHRSYIDALDSSMISVSLFR